MPITEEERGVKRSEGIVKLRGDFLLQEKKKRALAQNQEEILSMLFVHIHTHIRLSDEAMLEPSRR